MSRWVPGLQADLLLGTSLVFAELKDLVRRKIERYGLTRTINPRHFYPTTGAAIAAFREGSGAQWTADGQPPADYEATADRGIRRDTPSIPPGG